MCRMPEPTPFSQALQALIDDRYDGVVRQLAVDYEKPGATPQKIGNRSKTIGRWLKEKIVPSKPSVKRLESVLEVPDGSLEKLVRREPTDRDIRERVKEIERLLREVKRRLDETA